MSSWTWVGLAWVLSVPLSAWADMNLAEVTGHNEIKVSPSKVYEQMGHPIVLKMQLLATTRTHNLF